MYIFFYKVHLAPQVISAQYLILLFFKCLWMFGNVFHRYYLGSHMHLHLPGGYYRAGESKMILFINILKIKCEISVDQFVTSSYLLSLLSMSLTFLQNLLQSGQFLKRIWVNPYGILSSVGLSSITFCFTVLCSSPVCSLFKK